MNALFLHPLEWTDFEPTNTTTTQALSPATDIVDVVSPQQQHYLKK